MNSLKQLHHFAWKCKDWKETRDFYEGILKLPLVHTIEADYVPSTGQYAPYRHIFFAMDDNSHIAFFDLGDGQVVETNCDEWIVHFAMEVPTTDDILLWKEHLESHGVDVLGPVNHGNYIQSIYFFDPNNLRLEICTRLS